MHVHKYFAGDHGQGSVAEAFDRFPRGASWASDWPQLDQMGVRWDSSGGRRTVLELKMCEGIHLTLGLQMGIRWASDWLQLVLRGRFQN